MDERFSRGAVIDLAVGARPKGKWRRLILKALAVVVVNIISVSSLEAQLASPAGQPLPPRGIYTPKPVYRPEWAKQGLSGKGAVLVTIDKQTGKVTGARMLTSTGNQQLDGAALQAYSQWRFDPRTVAVPQLTIPVEFAKRPPQAPPPAKPGLPKPVILLIVLAIVGAAIAMLRKRNV